MKAWLAGILCLLCVPVMAAGGGSSGGYGASNSSTTKQQLQRVEQLVGAQQWQQAETLLRDLRQDAASSADVWNWSGYVARKSGRLSEAFPYYDKALKINPKHLGAHEYLGEAYLQNGEPQKAQEQLKILQGLCGQCEEARDLSAALKAAPQGEKASSSFLLGG